MDQHGEMPAGVAPQSHAELGVQPEQKTRGKVGRKKGGHDSKPRSRRSFGPYQFDKKTAREFIKNIKIGCPFPMAAGEAGVTVATLYAWIRKGKDKRAPEDLQKFRRDFHRARHFAGKQDVKTMFAASIKGNIDAAKWRLRTRYPKYFSEAATRLEVTGAEGGPIKTSGRLEVPSVEEMAARIVRATRIAQQVLAREQERPPSDAIEVTATTTSEGAKPTAVNSIVLDEDALPAGIALVGPRLATGQPASPTKISPRPVRELPQVGMIARK